MSRKATCLNSEQLTRAALDPGSTHLSERADQCPHCAATVEEIRALQQQARRLTVDGPTETQSDEMLSRILTADISPSGPGVRRTLLRAALIAAGLLILMGLGFAALFSRSVPTEPRKETPAGAIHRSTVYPNPGAVFHAASAQPDEIVRLAQGRITVQVDTLQPGERFRVVTGNGEIEVHGTVFDAIAENDALVAVRVISGKVLVRTQHRPEVVLTAGEQWSPPPLSDTEMLPDGTPMPADAPPFGAGASEKRRAVPDAPAKLPATGQGAAEPAPERPEEKAFNEGWSAYTAGEIERAVRRFDAAYAAAPRSRFAEDAMFWKAAALNRSRGGRPANDALSFFIEAYPKSRRTPEACVMLGWNRLNAGDTDAAERLFTRALSARSEKVLQNARRGLQRIARDEKPE